MNRATLFGKMLVHCQLFDRLLRCAMTDYPLPNVSTDLSGQVALVTGTTSGLGRRFAQVLAACGAKVAITGRRVDRLDELVQQGVIGSLADQHLAYAGNQFDITAVRMDSGPAGGKWLKEQGVDVVLLTPV